MYSLYKRIFAARKAKYKGIVLDIFAKKESISPELLTRIVKRNTKGNVQWYLIHRVLDDLKNEGKIEKREIKVGEQNIFMWTKK
jgi:predicted transcriptional regulator